MKQPLTAAIAAALSVGAIGQPTDPAPNAELIDVMTIIGSRSDARTIAGTGSVIDQQQIELEAATDINQLMKTIPGTYVREEDGFGLRPNIGIRAATSERSSKVTLMEDGVLIAPAPYSNPAAYYFPTTLRMSSVEVLKGAPLLRYGPQTTGGVINLVSTPIPDETTGAVLATVGQYSSSDIHAYAGGRNGQFGWLIETAQRDSEGFKSIDRSNSDTGYDIQDYVAKLAWEGERQRLLLKMQYSEEVSNETYLGLTDADFNRDSTRRYGLSSIDQMDNDHQGYNLTYSFDLNEQVTVTALAYQNEFARDWFKLGGGGDLVLAANQGDAFAQGILDGTEDAQDLEYKHNNRAYESSGIEISAAIDLGNHQLQVGIRDHEDEMDRFQPVELYDQINGSLVFDGLVQPTGGDNRLETGEALSIWVTDTWQATDALRVNLSLRQEDVETSRAQFADPARAVVASTRSNSSDELLPGASLTYDLNQNWQLLAGVHRGFSPLGGGAQSFQEPETSQNLEYGVRYNAGSLFVEAVGFYSDFENLTENCSNANPCSNGSTSGSFTTGEAEISGFELQIASTLEAGNFQIPLQFAYTYTQAEISEDNPISGVQDGDEVADIPETTFSLQAGLESDFGWNNYLVAKFTDEMCVNVGCSGGNFAETESVFVVDLISRYDMTEQATVFLKVGNLFDEQSIVSRSPDGARPNQPRTTSAGLEYRF